MTPPVNLTLTNLAFVALAATMTAGAQPVVDDLSGEELPPIESVVTEAPATEPAGALVAEPVPEFQVDRFEAATLYDFYVENEDFEQAVEVANVELILSEEEFGSEDLELVPTLVRLGDAQLLNDAPVDARATYSRAVGLLEDRAGIFDARLFEPLLGIGKADQMLGDHDRAKLSLIRAQHVSHRAGGVYNLKQLDAVRAMVESMMARDQWQEAEDLMLTGYKINRHNFGEESMEMLPAIYELGQWFHDIQDYRQARLTYRKAIAIVEREKGDMDPALIPALRGMASAYLEERDATLDKGLAAHSRIVDIVDSDPSISMESRILAHLELGDWYVQFGREQDAWAEYRIAWEMAQNETASERDWSGYLERPHLIHPGATLSVDFMGYGRVGDEVYYDFEFTIARDGRPRDIQIIGTNLHGQTRAGALQAFRYARFRPSIVDGTTVETAGYKVRRVYPTPPPDDYGTVGIGGNSGFGTRR